MFFEFLKVLFLFFLCEVFFSDFLDFVLFCGFSTFGVFLFFYREASEQAIHCVDLRCESL